MDIVDFPESNSVYGKGQQEYLPLPAYKHMDGEINTCWKPSLKERFIILFSGKIWLSVLTFNSPLQPVKVSVYKPEMD